MGRQKTFQPEQVLHQMMVVFWEKGFEATSIADLEVATGLNKRSLYNAFGNKDAIFDAALKTYMDGMSGMSRVLQAEPLGVANIRAFFSAMHYEAHGRGCLLTRTLNEGQPVSASTLEFARQAVLGMETLFLANLREACSEEKAKRLAKFLTSSVQGITTMARVDPDPERLRAVVESILAALDHEIPRQSG